MAQSAQGLRLVGELEMPPAGQVFVDGNHAYVGHMRAPAGTSIIDVSDPSKPRVVARIDLPEGLVHSHKVQIAGDLMLTNFEALWYLGAPPIGFVGGINIYDISRPDSPRKIGFWPCGGSGVHRFRFDGRYAYISPEMPGYMGNIVVILDLADPTKPEEAGRWWVPGQWFEGGEKQDWWFNDTRVHHPYRMNDRLYVSLWHGGFAILDISDISTPSTISHTKDWVPTRNHPTHSVLPFPFPVAGRRIALVADEDVQRRRPGPGADLKVLDIGDEANPVVISTFQVAGRETEILPEHTGCHQPVEIVRGTEVPVAWMREGVRLIDVADPLNPRETGHYVPEPVSGRTMAQTNDLFEDDRRLIYLVDRFGGMKIVERA